jgi:hypothetical protein
MAEVVRTLATFHRQPYVHLTCNTAPELRHNLGVLRRRPGYGILYLALHGHPGHIELGAADLSLDELAEYLGRGFKDWVVHFGTCQTMAVERAELRRFLNATGVAMVAGYRKSVDWVDAAALDFLLLDWLQEYRDTSAMWRRFKATYPDLIRVTGLTVLARS